ncbi:MAG: non-ribosomal peptide synthetase [Candidatus Eremiobacteraeota bacterium]|nr:non-ribosomal peptide synthetase [Candidatus Eremiobacteraeota bacterium]
MSIVRNTRIDGRDSRFSEWPRIEVPLSNAQEVMWFLDRVLPDPAIYYVPIAWRVKGSLDLECLQRAVNRLAERHEPLRTTFPTVENRPTAVVAPNADVPIRVRAAANDDAELTAILREEAREAFDLRLGPLFRVLLVRGFEDDVLVFTFHHIVCDCWSLAIVQTDFLELYDAERERREAALPPIAYTYADFASDDREAAANDTYEENLAWWAEHLRDLPRFELDGDRRPPAKRTVRGARISRKLGSDVIDRVRSFARAHRTTTFATLLAAYAALLARYSAKDEVVVGVPMGGRRRPELNPLVGDFTEMATLRIDADLSRSFGAFVSATQDELLDALTYAAAPFQLVVERVAPGRSHTHQPLFTVAMVELQPLRDAIAGGVVFCPLPLDTATAKFDLLLEVTEDRHDLTVTLEYSLDRFGDAAVAKLMDGYEQLVSNVLMDPAARLDDSRLIEADGISEPEGLRADPASSASGRAIEGDSEPSPVESRLRLLFQEVLGVPQVDLDENFFTLGGHSLLAAQLIARVEDTFPAAAARFRRGGGRSSLLRAFYKEPTARTLAKTLEGAPEPAESIVCMREGRPGKASVFWFHGQYNWNGLYAWNILRALPDDVPFYLVHPHGHDDEPFQTDVDTLVDERFEEVRRARAHGPYIIGGWCNGAIMAFEVARRLRALGETVENLVLCETPPLVAFGPSLAHFAHAVGARLGLEERKRVSLLCFLRALSSRIEGFARGTFSHRVAILKMTTQKLLRKSPADPHGIFAQDTAEAAQRHHSYVRAITKYHPGPCDCRADIIYGYDTFIVSGRPDGGWASHVAAASVHRLPPPIEGVDPAGTIGAIMSRTMAGIDRRE